MATETFRELGTSKLDCFLSGASSVVSPLIGHAWPDDSHSWSLFGLSRLEEPGTDESPWVAVGGFVVDALKEAVADDPSLPELPEDLYSAPDGQLLLSFE